MKNQPSTPEILSSLKSLGLSSVLSSDAGNILDVVYESKQISTGQMTDLLIPIGRKGTVFSVAIQVLTKIFSESDIRIVYVPTPTKLSKNLPLVSLQKKEVSVITHTKQVSVQKDLQVTSILDKTTRARKPNFGAVVEIESSHQQYLRDASKHALLKHEVLCELIVSAHDGNLEARNILITHNQKLVISIANRYYWTQNLQAMDLIQEGNLGLIKAIDMYDPTRGFAFSTYATWWITQRIQRSIQDFDKMVRTPVHVLDQRRKLLKIYNKIMQGIEMSGVTDIDAAYMHPDVMSRTDQLRLHEVYQCQTLDAPLFDEEGSLTLSDYLYDPYVLSPEERLIRKEELLIQAGGVITLIQQLRQINLSKKNDQRNKDMFSLYYGLKGGRGGQTLNAIGYKYKVTTERVRQIIVKTWQKLKSSGSKITYETIDREMAYLELLEGVYGKTVDLSQLKEIPSPKMARDPEDAPIVPVPLSKKLVLKESKAALSVIETVKIIADFYQIDEALVYLETRKREVVRVRHVAMYILKKVYGLTHEEIALRLGKEDHTTVVHGCKKVDKELETDPVLSKELKQLSTLFA